VALRRQRQMCIRDRFYRFYFFQNIFFNFLGSIL
jgi:hypothetical protein